MKLCFESVLSGKIINDTMYIVKVGSLTRLNGIEEFVVLYFRNLRHGNVSVIVITMLVERDRGLPGDVKALRAHIK